MAFIGYRLRGVDEELKGFWLTRIDVATKSGTTFLGSPNWLEVARRPTEFRINPRFHPDESWAWSGTTEEHAQTYQTILLSVGIRTEIVLPLAKT